MATPQPTTSLAWPAGAMPVDGAVILPGLRARVFMRGQDQSADAFPAPADLVNEQAWMAGASPNFTFLDQHINTGQNVLFGGWDQSPLQAFLSPDGFGPVTLSTLELDTILVDWTGYIHIPVAGNYDFNLTADDAAAVYLYGTYGTSGSGLIINSQNYGNSFTTNGNGVVNFGSDANYVFELFWYNQMGQGANGGASLNFSVTGPAPVVFYTPDAVDAVVDDANGFSDIRLGMAQQVPIPMLADTGLYNYVDDSVFPWLPSLEGNDMLTFYVSGSAYRTLSPAIGNLQPPNPAQEVLVAGGPGYDANGVWMMNAIRKADNTLVGLFHAEDHQFDSGSGEWDSAGVALSADDGNSWTKLGQIIGIPKPSVGTFGGREVTCMIWDSNNARWLGVGHGLGFTSSDPNAAPGTWYGYANGVFNQPEPDTAGVNTETVLPGLTDNMAECKLHYNTYLQKYLLLWRNWGGQALYLTMSDDAIHWAGTVTLYESGDPNMFVEYTQLMGPTDVLHGQDTWFLYQQRPSTYGRFRDTVVRALHFE